MFADHENIFGWKERLAAAATVKPWKPHALDHVEWTKKDYRAVYAWRMQTLDQLRNSGDMLASARVYYKSRAGEFIMHWCDTFDPRKSGSKWMPFVFFAKQQTVIQFFDTLVDEQENGLIEKCRDAGVTWLACGWSVHGWLFRPDFSIGWGSRKENLVDTIGDADSIFEKLRLMVNRLPDIWKPKGFNPRIHATFMKLINPENGSTITGESGDNIGRGGRKSVYFKDESAHYERPEKIESALGDNTNVQIDISSVNGLGNVFHRRREAGIDWSPGATVEPGYTRVLVIDWSDHPDKTPEWYEQRKARAEREGLQHIFAQEVDRDYSAAVSNTIISAEWIRAAIDAHLKIPYLLRDPSLIPDVWEAGLDIADGGIDKNALIKRQWIICRHASEWGSRDPGVTARNTIVDCKQHRRIRLQYDNIGVGATFKSEYNRLCDENPLLRTQLPAVGWNAGAAVIYPHETLIPNDDHSITNDEMFGNFKAQAWWHVRTLFYKTWRAVTFGDIYAPEELISLDGTMPLLHQLCKELAQPQRAEDTRSLKMIIDKRPPGTKSPNVADAFIMAYFPAPQDDGAAVVGGFSV